MKTCGIRVTAKDIRLGVRGAPSGCPVARALKRRFPGHSASVNVWTVRIGGPLRGQVVKTPMRVARWIAAFDLGGKAARRKRPFKFRLRLEE